jgi:hypothetical protein
MELHAKACFCLSLMPLYGDSSCQANMWSSSVRIQTRITPDMRGPVHYSSQTFLMKFIYYVESSIQQIVTFNLGLQFFDMIIAVIVCSDMQQSVICISFFCNSAG